MTIDEFSRHVFRRLGASLPERVLLRIDTTMYGDVEVHRYDPESKIQWCNAVARDFLRALDVRRDARRLDELCDDWVAEMGGSEGCPSEPSQAAPTR